MIVDVTSIGIGAKNIPVLVDETGRACASLMAGVLNSSISKNTYSLSEKSTTLGDIDPAEYVTDPPDDDKGNPRHLES
jgi:hypothetical protein